MRKDVKFGLTIGGILVVTLVIYVIVLSRGPAVPQHVGITLQQPTDQPAGSTDASANLASNAKDKGNAHVSADEEADANAPIGDSDKPTAQSNENLTSTPLATPATQPAATANANSTPSNDWDNALNHGLPPALSAPTRTETPTIDSSTNTVARADVNRPTNVPMIDSLPTTQPARALTSAVPMVDSTPAPLYASAAPTTADPPTPATPGNVPTIDAAPLGSTPTASTPSASRPRTHRVEAGESPYSIAQEIYGNGKYYKKILAANPKVDPRHLRIGTVLVIPELSDADKPRVASGNATQSAAIDSRTQYTVVAGDTLESISRRLYGGPEMIGKIYQANRSLMGDNENALKIGWVLKLPQPPTQSGDSGGMRAN